MDNEYLNLIKFIHGFMELIHNIPFKFVIPVILLTVQFSFKFFVDRRATAYNFVVAILEVPISIIFITLSLTGGFIVTGKSQLKEAFIIFLLIILLLFFCILFWRRSVEHFEKKNFGYTVLLGVLNFFLSIPLIIAVVSELIDFSK